MRELPERKQLSISTRKRTGIIVMQNNSFWIRCYIACLSVITVSCADTATRKADAIIEQGSTTTWNEQKTPDRPLIKALVVNLPQDPIVHEFTGEVLLSRKPDVHWRPLIKGEKLQTGDFIEMTQGSSIQVGTGEKKLSLSGNDGKWFTFKASGN